MKLSKRIWELPFWVFLLPLVLMLGWSHLKDAENERVQQRWTARVKAVEAKVAATESLAKEYRAGIADLDKRMAAAEARGGATKAETRGFRAQATRLDARFASLAEQSQQARTMLDQLQADKKRGLFDKR